MALVDRLRAAREVWTDGEAGEIKLLIRRPTQYQTIRLQQEPDVSLAMLRIAVVDWKASSLALGIPGGDSAPERFDVETFIDWVTDRPDTMIAILTFIAAEQEKATGVKASIEKN